MTICAPVSCRGRLESAIATFNKTRDVLGLRREASAIEAELGRAADRIGRRLEGARERLLELERRPAWSLALSAVRAAGIAAMSRSDRLIDFNDARHRPDLERLVEHRLATPGPEADRAVLSVLIGIDEVTRLRTDLRQLGEARAAVGAFMRGAARADLGDLDLRELQAVLLPSTGVPAVVTCLPEWAVAS